MSLEDELAIVTRQLRDHSAASRIEWHRALNESHLWSDEQYRDFAKAFQASTEAFLHLLARKRQIERDLAGRNSRE